MPIGLYKDLGYLFFSSLILSLVLTPLTARLSYRFGALDVPDGRKMHDRVVPRLGGIAIAFALVIPLLWILPASNEFLVFLAGAVLVSLTGFIDDVFLIHPAWKFFGQVLAVSVFVFFGGGTLTSLGDLFGTGPIVTGPLAPWVTILCAVGVINALNLSDGLDGLAGGISAIACAFLGVFACLQNDWLSLAILVGLLGGILGFLRYNTYPASLFMGDTGSMLLGYILATIAIRLARPGVEGGFAPVTIAAVLALPIMDTLWVMFRRLWKGENPFHPDKTHLHHRVMNLGLSHVAVVSLLYAGMVAYGFLAWGARSLPERWQLALVLILGVIVHGGVVVLRVAMGRECKPFWRPLPWRVGAAGETATAWTEKSIPVVSWSIGIGLFAPTLAPGSVPAMEGLVALAMAGFLVALFPWGSHKAKTSICFGLMYVACVCIIGILHLLPGTSAWIPVYMAVFSSSVLIWVLVKLNIKRRNRDAMISSAFETLLYGVSLFVGIVVVPALKLGESLQNAILLSCLESVPLILALKIIVRKDVQRNYIMTWSLVVALLLIGVRGLWGDMDLIEALLSPAVSHAKILH